MPKDEHDAFLHVDASPDPGGPGRKMSLREQVLEMIHDVLADPCPAREWARNQLRRLLAARPNDPESAFLEHLITTRRTTARFEEEGAAVPEDLPVRERLRAESLHSEPREIRVLFGRRNRERIEAVLGKRMLLTAFQPIRELPNGKMIGVEALTRFVSENGASADAWFREAAGIGLGSELERASLQCALSAAVEVPQGLFVAFNLSPATLTRPRVIQMLTTSGVSLDRIVVELTGRAGDGVWNDLIHVVTPLRHQGLRVAVDGSGPGFMRTAQIRTLRPDIIKVDRTFIGNIVSARSPDDPAAIELAWEVGAVLAAEGIETEDELAAVMRAGMTVGQGYLLGRPSVHPLDWSAWIIKAESVASGTS